MRFNFRAVGGVLLMMIIVVIVLGALAFVGMKIQGALGWHDPAGEFIAIGLALMVLLIFVGVVEG